MNRGFSGGKRAREGERNRKKRDKQDRLRRNRDSNARGTGSDIAEVAPLPEVKLEDIVIGVPSRPKTKPASVPKLFVGGLSWETTRDDLRHAFAKFGNIVDSVVINDRMTGRSRGFGFVTFETSEEAAEAIKGMNGVELDGRTLKVNLAEGR